MAVNKSTGYSGLFAGELLDADQVAVRANRKYHAALLALATVHKSESSALLQTYEDVANLPRSLIFNLLSSPLYRNFIDASFARHFRQDQLDDNDVFTVEKLRAIVLALTDGEHSGGDPVSTLCVVGSDDNGDPNSTAIHRLFDLVMADTVATEKACILAEVDGLAGEIAAALEMIESCDPTLSRQILLNTRYVGYIDIADQSKRNGYREIAQSVSSHQIPSTCFISYHSRTSLPVLAEALLHESLHKKLSNTLYFARLLLDDVETTEKFLSYWNKDSQWNSNKWEYDRALYALHFYIHFFAFYSDEKFRQMFAITDSKRSLAEQRAIALWSWVTATWPTYLTREGYDFFGNLIELSKLGRQSNAYD